MKKLRLRGYSASGAMLPCVRACLPVCLVDGLRRSGLSGRFQRPAWMQRIVHSVRAHDCRNWGEKLSGSLRLPGKTERLASRSNLKARDGKLVCSVRVIDLCVMLAYLLGRRVQ